MSDILTRIRDTYQQNPAATLSLLPDLFQAVENGRVIELPCKVGDTVYWLSYFGNGIHQGEVSSIKTSGFGFDLEIQTEENLLFKREAKRVFLAYEAAAQTLKERVKNG